MTRFPLAKALSATRSQACQTPNIVAPATVNSDGTKQLKYDLSGVPNGSYTVTITANNASGPSPASVSLRVYKAASDNSIVYLGFPQPK